MYQIRAADINDLIEHSKQRTSLHSPRPSDSTLRHDFDDESNKNLVFGNTDSIPQTYESVQEFDLSLQELSSTIQNHLERVQSQQCRHSTFLLGYHFDVGSECEVDTAQAIYWYTRAASRGHTVAQLNLGVLHETGHQDRCERDYKRAVFWYYQASTHGHSGAQFNLGRMFWSGLGVTRDYRSSFRCYQRASRLGNAMALANVGAMYMSGNGVSQNSVKALKWSQRAASKGNAVAHHNLAMMLHQQNDPRAKHHFLLAMDPSLEHTVDAELSADLRRSMDPLIFT